MPEGKKIKLYLLSLRLERWPRSLAIVPGFAAVFVLNPKFSRELTNPGLAGKLILAFLLTWLISTANYIVNEIADAPFDAFHPIKKNRPLVKNKISKKVLLMLWILFVVTSVIIGYIFFNLLFLLSLGILLMAGFLYNVPPIRFKDIPYLDSTLESANNPIRFMIGWYVLAVAFPPLSLLLSWWAFGNFLMVGKRVAEKKFLTSEVLSGYRLSLNRYTLPGLIAFMIANAVICLVTFVWFALEVRITTFLLSIPFIIIYLIIFVLKSLQDRDVAEEPEKLLKNPYFALFTIFLFLVFLIAYIFR